jgi:enoyl-CoA hydratase/carnithine racemase
MINPMNGETPPVLQRDDRSGVTILTLNRPAKLNALSNDLLAAIMRTLDDIEIDPAVSVIVFAGAGRAFSAGAEALALANLLSSKPSLTLAATLGAIYRGMDASIDDGLAVEEAAFARIVSTHDAREGVATFLEKRVPRFLGQ